MMFNWKTMFVGLLLVSLIVSGRLANHYRDNAISYKEQREPSREALIEMIQVLWQEEDVDLAVELAIDVLTLPKE
ncbi:hypothetical protein FI669_09865 [Salmonella enterica subsp. enterica serovar 1,4,[5],12:i:-]|nr:hypothetical protein FI669_09865 [Salmonella enterica subsp. enterica serovar 1,4,[5],12:i:-]